MKLLLVCLALASTSFSLPLRTINDDVWEILEMLPMDKIKQAAKNHMENDSGYRLAMSYIYGKEWNQKIKELSEIKVAVDAYNYLKNDVGIYVDKILEAAYGVLTDAQDASKEVSMSRSFNDFLNEWTPYINITHLLAKFDEVLQRDEEFKKLYERLSSETTKEYIKALMEEQPFQELLNGLESVGIDARQGLIYLFYFFGWYN